MSVHMDWRLLIFHSLNLFWLRSEEVALLTGKKKKDTLYIPVSRKFLRVVAASAAAVTLFLLVSTPVEDVNQAAYTASFVPTEMVARNAPEMKTEEMSAPVETVGS